MKVEELIAELKDLEMQLEVLRERCKPSKTLTADYFEAWEERQGLEMEIQRLKILIKKEETK